MNQQMIVPQQNGEALASLERLESRIHGTIDLLRSARRGETAAEQEAERLKQRLSEKERELERLKMELKELRSEREQVRQRVEALLDQVEQLAE